jgi:hypothetical protein
MKLRSCSKLAAPCWAALQVCMLVADAAADGPLGNFERSVTADTPIGQMSFPARIEVAERTEGDYSKIDLRLAINLSPLQAGVQKLLVLPHDNCRSFAADNLVAQADSALAVDGARLRLTVKGDVVVWSCVENPALNTKVEWKEKGVGLGIKTRVPEVITTKGPPIKTIVGKQPYSVAAGFGFKLAPDGKLQVEKSVELHGASGNLLKSDNALKAALDRAVDSFVPLLTRLSSAQTALGTLPAELGRLKFSPTGATFTVQDGKPVAHLDFAARASVAEVRELKEKLR